MPKKGGLPGKVKLEEAGRHSRPGSSASNDADLSVLNFPPVLNFPDVCEKSIEESFAKLQQDGGLSISDQSPDGEWSLSPVRRALENDENSKSFKSDSLTSDSIHSACSTTVTSPDAERQKDWPCTDMKKEQNERERLNASHEDLRGSSVLRVNVQKLEEELADVKDRMLETEKRYGAEVEAMGSQVAELKMKLKETEVRSATDGEEVRRLRQKLERVEKECLVKESELSRLKGVEEERREQARALKEAAETARRLREEVSSREEKHGSEMARLEEERREQARALEEAAETGRRLREEVSSEEEKHRAEMTGVEEMSGRYMERIKMELAEVKGELLDVRRRYEAELQAKAIAIAELTVRLKEDLVEEAAETARGLREEVSNLEEKHGLEMARLEKESERGVERIKMELADVKGEMVEAGRRYEAELQAKAIAIAELTVRLKEAEGRAEAAVALKLTRVRNMRGWLSVGIGALLLLCVLLAAVVPSLSNVALLQSRRGELARHSFMGSKLLVSQGTWACVGVMFVSVSPGCVGVSLAHGRRASRKHVHANRAREAADELELAQSVMSNV